MSWRSIAVAITEGSGRPHSYQGVLKNYRHLGQQSFDIDRSALWSAMVTANRYASATST